MGKKSRAELIAELKSAGTRGSLSKMNLTKLSQLHATAMAGSGQAANTTDVTGGGTSMQTPVAALPGQQQSMQAISGSGTKKKMLIDPDSDDVDEYLSGGSFWTGLAGDVSKVGHTVASEAKKLQKTDAVKDVELAGVDVGEVAADVGADTAALAGSTAVGNPELAGPASVAIDVGSHEAADSLREKIRDS